jgi:hypothetical protein
MFWYGILCTKTRWGNILNAVMYFIWSIFWYNKDDLLSVLCRFY